MKNRRNLIIFVCALIVFTTIISTGSVLFFRSNSENKTSSSVPSTTTVTTTTSITSTPPLVPKISIIAQDFNVPWGLAFLPDNTPIIGERNTGKIFTLSTDSFVKTELITIPNVLLNNNGEGGLLGIAISPDFLTDKSIYVYFTTSTDNRIIRFNIETKVIQPILTGMQRSGIHNGGALIFGPDNKLYAGTGDAGKPENSQNKSNLNGKVLRINPDGSIPTDNPFPNSLIYSLGHRNIQGLSFDTKGNLWQVEFGQNKADEINVVQAGKNYGWPICEGPCANNIPNKQNYTDPTTTWPTSEASPSGGVVIGNNLYVATLRGARLWKIPLTTNNSIETPKPLLLNQYGRLRSVTQAPDNSLWITTSNRDGRGTVNANDDKIIRIENPELL